MNVVGLLLATGLLAGAAAPADAPPLRQQLTYKRADDRELKLLIEKPADWKPADKRPAIVFFFGGGWVGGTPEQFRKQSEYLATRGMVGVRVEYRTMPRTNTWPPTLCCADAKSAMRYVRAHAAELGIDPDRIAAAGGSAGGHLAAFTALVPGQDDPADDAKVSCKPQALVLFNPVLNNGPGQWGHQRVGDRYREFSPAHNIGRDAPPAIVFLGDNDKLIPVSVIRDFEKDMQAAGTRCEARIYPGAGHGFFNREPYFSLTLIETDKFLASLGWIKGPPTLEPGDTPGGVQAVDLRTEWLVEPAGIDAATPRLSWRLESKERGQRQTACQVLVATDESLLRPGSADLWDTGKMTGDETLNLAYQGKPLASGRRCVWSVRVWDANGKPSPWSAPASWGMGLPQSGDWTAEWISFRDKSPLHTNRQTLFLPPARYYRGSFRAGAPVKRAMLYYSVLGIGEFYVNGKRVGDGWFESGWADYHNRAYYRAHDVTPLIARGDNRIGAIVADGWYAGYVGYGLLVGYGPNKAGRYFYGKTPAFIAQLEIEYADGSRQRVSTGPAWEVSGDGPIREADLIMGETFDARQHDPGWCSPGPESRSALPSARPWHWEPAIPAGENGSTKAVFSDNCGEREVELGFRRPPRLQAYAAPPIRVTQELPARQLTEPEPGVYLFDFGQNFAGVVRLKVRGEQGTKVQIRFGEMLHRNGRLMTENLRKARATDFYILRGDQQGETWTPRFTYHGFQYVELRGLRARPSLDTVTGCVLHNDTPLASEFACSDPVMTRFWKNTQWTQRANFIEMPTDCPQRDERLGWMGDAQIYARTASYNADVAAFFTKWLDDVAEAQRAQGPYPDYCPYPMGHGARGQTWGTAWTDAGIICPHTIWRVYGDTRLLERNWDSMTRFMEWRRARAPNFKGGSDGNQWGDWLNVNENTPIEYIDAAYFKLDADLMAEIAEALGRTEAAAEYRRLSQQIAARFAADYLDADGALKVKTQTAHVLALEFNLVPAGSRPAIANRLAELIARNEYRMATGFLGTKPLLPALSGSGQHDLAVRLFQSRRFPSWGYEVEQGATSVWERWDSYTKEHGFNGASGNQNASMNSFSHYSFGAVMQWAFQTLAGIDSDVPGFKHIVIRPRPPKPGTNPEREPVNWVRAYYDSARGRIVSHWRRTAIGFELDVVIPPNTTATIHLPAGSAESVLEGGQPLARTAGVTSVRTESGHVVLDLQSGSYSFTSRLP